MTGPATVLLIDDTDALRRLVRRILDSDGRFRVVGEAGDGEAGVGAAEALHPDAVVIGAAMPKMNGLFATREIRRLNPGVKIVVMSGFSAGQLEGEARLAGADAYLEKGNIREALPQLLGALLFDGSAAPPSPSRAEPVTEAARRRNLETLGRLLGSVGHDFGNVLQVVQTYLDFIETSAAERGCDDIAHDARTAREAAERGTHLVKQLLHLARADDVVAEPFDVNALIREMEGVIRVAARGAVTLELDLAEEIPPVAMGPADLEQSLLNLVVNARDAMPVGGRLRIVTRRAGDAATVTVSDNGLGMLPEVLARAGEPFFTTKAEAGTGLGLATVKDRMRRAGGSVTVTSEPGVGTDVALTVPLARLAPLTAAP